VNLNILLKAVKGTTLGEAVELCPKRKEGGLRIQPTLCLLEYRWSVTSLELPMAKKRSPLGFILVDRYYEQPRKNWARTSLWKSFLSTISPKERVRFVQISISERKRSQKTKAVRIDTADIVIVNWDAANGDYVCGSDDVLLYFQTQRDKRDALLRRRGKLLCEFQCGSGMLLQGAYEAIFGQGEVVVVEAKLSPEAQSSNEDSEAIRRQDEEEKKWTNKYAVGHWLFRGPWFFPIFRHPLLKGLSSKVESGYGPNKQPLFNFDNSPQRDFFSYRQRGSIYRGWFTSWEKGWVPLLIAKPKWTILKRWSSPPPAVLLAKCHEGGLMLASTMWMAVPGAEPLVQRILDTDVEVIARLHKAYTIWRIVTDVIWGVLILVALWWLRAQFPRPAHTAYDQIGWFWGTFVAFRFWKHLFWKRPYGGNVLRFLRQRWRPFVETI